MGVFDQTRELHSQQPLCSEQKNPRKSSVSKVLVLLATMMALCCCLGLSGCGNASKTITNGLVGDFTSITQGDTETMQKYFGFDPSKPFVDAGISTEDFASSFFGSLGISVDSVDVNDDTATANLTISNVNYTKGISNYESEIGSYLTSSGSMASSDSAAVTKKAAELLLSSLSSTDNGISTSSVTLTYKKVDGTWTLQNPDDLTEAIFGKGFDLQSDLLKIDTGINDPSVNLGTSETTTTDDESDEDEE